MNKWRNPYVDLVKTLPELLIDLANIDEQFTRSIYAQINSKKTNFMKTAVEIGSGAGGYLIQRAQQSPETLFVGFELRFKRAFLTAQRAAKLNLENILVIRGNAICLADIFPDHCLAEIIINFPDPWNQKRRWVKKRLLNANFLELLANKLEQGHGKLLHKTDSKEYYEESVRLINNSPHFMALETATIDYQSSHSNEDILSEFETLFKGKKKSIYSLIAFRVQELKF